MLPKETYIGLDGVEQIGSEHIGIPELSITRIQCKDKVVMLNKETETIFWAKCDFPEEKSDGIHAHVKDMDFPFRSSVDPHNMWAMNMVKALFIEVVKLANWTFLFINKQKALDAFNRVAWKIINPYILKESPYTTVFAQELLFFIETFLENLGMTKGSSHHFAIIMSHILENDNAYNLRLKDIFACFDENKLAQNPRKEIKRIIEIIKQRELAIGDKMVKPIRFINLLLLIPKIKKAFTKTVDYTCFENLSSDENDIYWQAFREDYNYQGLTKPQRLENAEAKNWSYPEHLKKIQCEQKQ